MKTALHRYVLRLGIDIQDRLPSDGHFHFFDEAGYEKLRAQYGLAPGSVATHSTSSHLLVKTMNDAANTLGGANHELLHVVSHRIIGITASSDGSARVHREKTGYLDERNDDFLFMNEAITELTNIQVIAEAWSGEVALSKHSGEYTDIGYRSAVSFLSDLIDDLALKSGHSRQEVFATLQRQYFAGGSNGFELLQAAYGRRGLGLLRTLSFDGRDIARARAELGVCGT